MQAPKLNSALAAISLIFGTFLATASPLHANPTTIAEFRPMKNGFFVHYVWGGDAYTVRYP